MPANSETIRISVDLPRDMYFAMHTETERNGQTHAGFTRKAIEEKLGRQNAAQSVRDDRTRDLELRRSK